MEGWHIKSEWNEIEITIRQKLEIVMWSCQWSTVLWSVVILHPKAEALSPETPRRLAEETQETPIAVA